MEIPTPVLVAVVAGFFTILGGGAAVALIRIVSGDASVDRAKIVTEAASVALAMVRQELQDSVDARLLLEEELVGAREEREILIGYILYLHDRLAAYGIVVPTLDEWKAENAETARRKSEY